MATNHVMCYKNQKQQWQAEIRSKVPMSNRAIVANYVRYVKPAKSAPISGNVFRCQLPYVKQDVPLCIVFRALGYVSDKAILELIVYDFKDHQMMEILRPSLEESYYIQHQNIALDFIGRRGTQAGTAKEQRIQWAKEVLQKEMLAHVGTQEFCQTRKAFFLGYMVHKLCSTILGRREIDDRGIYISYTVYTEYLKL